jgi:hypothetical protein
VPRRYPLYPLVALEIICAGTGLYIIGLKIYAEYRIGPFGEHAGITAAVSTTGIEFGVGWGWKSNAIMRYRGFDSDYIEIGHEFLGFLLGYRLSQYYWVTTLYRPSWIIFRLPWWFFAAFVVARPLERFEHRRRIYVRAKLRSRRGRCHNCGYDLRASPDRCPECGATRRQLSR